MSHSAGNNRKLSLYKLVEDENFVHKSANMTVSAGTRTQIKEFLFRHPEAQQKLKVKEAVVNLNSFLPFALTCSPVIPPQLTQNDQKILKIRENLSIYGYKDRILEIIDNNRIVLIQGRFVALHFRFID